MVVLGARDLSRQYDRAPVFTGVTFDVRAGEKIGLVGPNGCGKTTLLEILAGRDEPDVGAVERPPSVSIGFLAQHSEPPADLTLIEHARSGLSHLYDLQHEAHQLAERMASAAAAELDRLQEQYDRIHLELERLDAYNIEHRVAEVLSGLGFVQGDYNRPLITFSGGQQNRATLARLLLAAPDILLLDEPTNHLDLETTQWLESFLTRSNQAMIVVSHDRYFLDQVTSRTIELWQAGISDYPGNFSFYWSRREERLKVLRRTREKQEEYIARQEDFIRRNAYGQKAAQAKDREKKLERVEVVDIPPDFSDVRMGFPQPRRTGDWVLRTENLQKGFPTSGESARPLFSDLTLQIDRGDRVGILGPNGCGKTTLLRTLIGELAPDAGHVRFGANVEVGYFDQQLASVDPDLDAVEAVRAPAPSLAATPMAHSNPELKPGDIRSLLGRFGVSGDLGLQRVAQMSGGERTKVALARLYAMRPNLMMLDEPTNHLDFWACAALERSLREFDGTVLFVSHDRYFIDRVATKVLVFEDGSWKTHEGNYSDYQHFIASNRQPTRSEPVRENRQQKADAPKRKRKFPYRTVEALEADIAAEEERVESLEADLADPDVHRDPARIKQVQKDYAQAQERLEQLMEHWEEACELN